MRGVMAVNLLFALTIFTVSAASLNLEPPEFLGPYTDDPTRWPYGGCVEVSKIYPAPGSHLLPPADKYAKYWDLNITVVFSRPVTRILWDYGIRTWLRNSSLNRDREVLSCAKKACLMVVHNGEYIYLSSKTAKPTERGKTFNDEFQFTFEVPTYVIDHMSEILFALDGGLMYSPIYKFISNPHVEYVPYVAVRYLPPQNSPLRRPPERDTNYWVNYPSTCATRGGLIHRPNIFSRIKRKQQMATDNSPKLLTELNEIMTISNEGKRKLKLYYRLKQPGVYNVELPVSIKVFDNDTGMNISFSVPTVKSLVIDFNSPRLYIPVTTKFIFDYRERAYYEAPRWVAYLFTWKNVENKTAFDCNMFDYPNKLPNPASHNHQVTIRSLSDGYQLMGTPNYGLRLILYHQFSLPYDKQFYFIIPENMFHRYELYSEFDDCYHNVYDEPRYCYLLGWNPYIRRIYGRNLTTLLLDPYWKLINIHDKYSGEVIDSIMINQELSKTIYASLGYLNKISNKIGGTMHHSATGSLYEKDMLRVIPLLNINRKFFYHPKRRKLKAECHGGFKRSVGKWGKLKTYIEHGNMYRLHIPKSSSSWTVQQTFKVRSNDNNGNLTSAIVSFPQHIKRAVERYAALTNVQPNVYSATERDTRLRTARESYPLDKAVFLPRDLINKHGCGTLNITEDDVSRISQYYWTCDEPPDNCTGLPFDSLDRFPLIPPFNVLDLIGPVDHINTSRQRYKRALYYRDNNVNDLFILYTPNSHYTGVVEISGVEIEDPEFVEKSCNDSWKFSPGRHEITKGYLIGTIINKGKGGSDVVVTVKCTPNLMISPENATVWIDPHQTKIIRIVLFLYPKSTKSSSAMYKCKISTSINVTPFKSVVGKTFPICDLFIPTFDNSFVDPCESYADHEIIYYHLPKRLYNGFLLNTTIVGREYNLLTLINIKLIKYHIIQLSCDNSNILALTEDQLLFASTNSSSTSIDLIYSSDKLLQERVYIFKRKRSGQDLKTGCSLTLISIPFTSCGILTRRRIILTKADQRAYAITSQEREVEETRTKVMEKAKKPSWYKSISNRDDVLSAILVCLITSLIFIVLIVTGRSALLIHDKTSTPMEKKMEQIQAEMQLAKQEHEETWNNPRMYLKSGMLGPYYDLHNFKATDALDSADLKMLKLSGQLKYKDKVLQVVVEYIDEIVVKKAYSDEMPTEVWLRASTGMYLLKQSHASEDYKDEFNSLLQRCMERNTIEY